MADYRQIHTKIWKDSWFLELGAEEKLLFIYLFSNGRTSVAGIYDLSIKVMVFETGLERSVVEKALKKFSDADKVYYQDGVVWVRNLRRYNATSSVKVLERIRRDLEALPDCELKSAYISEWGIPEIPEKHKEPYASPEPKREGRAAGSRSAQTQVRRRLVKERGEKCEWCGKEGEVELHHIVPVRAGGSLDDDNCLLLCPEKCHPEADAINREKYPIHDSKIPYSQTDNEHEQEQEQEQEQEHTKDAGASLPGPNCDNLPRNLNGWLAFVKAGQGQKGGMTARLHRMIATLYPDSPPPDYGRIGTGAKRVGGASRLAHLVWMSQGYRVTGDVVSYCEKMHTGGGDNGQNRGRSTPAGTKTAEDIQAEEVKRVLGPNA